MRNKKGQFVKGAHWRPKRPWWDREWLVFQYQEEGRSAGDIAREYGVTENAILFWLHKHEIPRRSISEARALKHWGSYGIDNPVWNKRGELNPNWAGGVTPDRQIVYASRKWKRACSLVWQRDKATCQRCGLQRGDSPDMPFHIHHIESFANKKLRTNPNNLVLLCEACHYFIHSKENVDRDYLP